MQKVTIILITLLLSLYYEGNTQHLSQYDSLSREKAKMIVDLNLVEQIKESNYLVFSMGDLSYLVVIERSNCYEEYYFADSSTTKSKVRTVNKPNEIYSIAFDTASYHKGYITFNADFYKKGYTKAWGGMNYFILKSKNGQEYGELRLSTIVEPNPINNNVYNYLQTQLLNYISETDFNDKKKK